MEDYVTFEQATKLKELGFDWECDFVYYFTYHNHNKPIFSRYETVRDYEMEKYWYAPTLSQAQKWLREVRKEHLIVNIDRWITATPYRFEIYQEIGETIIHQYTQNDFPTYEQALSAGIDKALELLK